MKIFAWPPVGVVGTEWTADQPIQRSRNAWTGARSVSAMGPRRRLAALNVSALAKDAWGAGYSESLKRLLDGGVNLVRLRSGAINWHLQPTPYRPAPLGWTTGGNPLAWGVDGQPLRWFTGPTLAATPGTDSEGYDTITVTGLPAGVVLAGPGDVLRVYPSSGPGAEAGVSAQIVAPVRADADGVAVARLFSPVPAGVVSFGDSEEAVFEALEMPRSPQSIGANWFYRWSFIEVLPAEYAGAEEVNPWG